MKKLLIPVAAITIGLSSYAFTPVEKDNSLDNEVSSAALAAGRCDENYQTATTFSKCAKTWTEETEVELGLQNRVLDLY